jgi:hypothetical protein
MKKKYGKNIKQLITDLVEYEIVDDSIDESEKKRDP